MDWNECVEEAKNELGITGWTDDWDEVILLAKEKYWNGDSFKELKKETIENGYGICQLCLSANNLTAHHIYYKDDTTICLCKKCHKIIHKIQNKYGFLVQRILNDYQYYDTLNDMEKEVSPIEKNVILQIKEEIKNGKD